MESVLIRELPISAVKVNRRIVPPGIHFEILERVPVAFATKKGKEGIENGMIDINGFWIPIMGSDNINLELDEKIIVDGWIKTHKKSIAKIFKYEINNWNQKRS